MNDPTARKPVPTVSRGLVVLLTLAGSVLMTLAAYSLHRPDLGLGTAMGGPFCILNYLGLQVLTSKLLNVGNGGQGPFWSWSLLRYGIVALVFAVLARISILCLLGVLAVYLWSLGVLLWAGTRKTTLQKPTR